MDVERLVRSIDARLEHLAEPDRAEVADAVREAFARERRWSQLTLTVETERERRQEAEAMRSVLEGIVRQAHFEETIEEVLKQLSRIVTFDSCSLALLEPGGHFRIVAARGFPEPGRVIGLRYRDALSEEIRQSHQSLALSDVQEDERYVQVDDSVTVRSWAGIPLLVEGEVIGLLCLDRHGVDPFVDEDVHRARVVAFSAAAAIRKARLLEQVQRYASLQEWLVSLYEMVLEGRGAAEVARGVLEGALRLGYPGGMLVAPGDDGRPRVVAAAGEGLEASVGREVSWDLDPSSARRLGPEDAVALARRLGVELEPVPLHVVPLTTRDAHLGALALLDPAGETASDALTQAYASRAAGAWRYASGRS